MTPYEAWSGLVTMLSGAGALRLPLPFPTTADFPRVRRRADERVLLERLAAPYRTERQLARLARGPRAAGESFRFAVLGDSEPGRFWIWRKLFNEPGVFEHQLRLVQDEGVDFSMQLGDMVSRGIQRNYLRFFRSLERCAPAAPYLTVIGNHDRRFPHGRADSALYRRLFGATNYWFDRGPARCVVVDSSGMRVTRAQLRWLDRVLDTPLRKLVFTHIPPAPLRGGWTDFGGARGIGGFRHGAEEFMRVLERRRADRVYMGHIHCFGVQDVGPVRYVLSGGGGSPLYPTGMPDRYHHYLTVTVGPKGVEERVHPFDGASWAVPKAVVRLAR